MSIAFLAAALFVIITILSGQVASSGVGNQQRSTNHRYHPESQLLKEQQQQQQSDNSSSSVFNIIASGEEVYDVEDDDGAEYYRNSPPAANTNGRLKRTPIYHNEFAVYIPGGGEMADTLAHKYGYVNMGQVRYFLHYLINLKLYFSW